MVRGVLPKQKTPWWMSATRCWWASSAICSRGGFGIVLGVELARQLGVGRGDKVTLITPQGQITLAGMMPQLKQFTVVGVFKVDMFEYDASLAMIQLKDAQTLFRLDDAVSGVRLKLNDLMLAPAVKACLAPKLTYDMYLTDWTDQHASYFRRCRSKTHDVHHSDADCRRGGV